jgi:phage terminase large subunit
MNLTTKQEYCVYYLNSPDITEIIYGGSAGGGKSVIGCLWLIEMCQKYPGTRWIMGRAKLKTLKETTLNTFFQLSSRFKIGNQYTYNQQSGVIKFINGSEILLKDLFLYPSDPEFDELGSLEITGAFIDEISQITVKAWQIVKSRCRYMLNEYGLTPKILGTCNPSKGWVYKRIYKPFKDKKLPENIAFVKALPTDNPHLPESYLKALDELDPVSRARLRDGDWEYDDDPAKLIEYEAILNCFTNTFVEEGESYITADIARFGRDRTVIGVWSGYRLIQIITFDQNKITEAAQEIKQLAEKYKVPMRQVLVDEDGVGGGVVDILGCWGFTNNARPERNPENWEFENFNNLKSQCYFKLADFINKNLVYICESPYSELIIEELEQVKQDKIDSDGKKQVMNKEKVKANLGRSPDFSDMLMMRMYYWYNRPFNHI